MNASEIEVLLLRGSIADIGNLYRSGLLGISDALQWYRSRIEALNRAGPALNAVREVSADVSREAANLEEELRSGRDRGPLHGIPVLLKDNILAAGMRATAGAAALSGFTPARDATVVRSLRAAGALILGKTNLTEFADYVSDVMPSEFSAAGGVVKNPHGIAYGRGQGSSVGSAASVCAGLAPLALGSETQNSVQTPALYSSVVGFKPTVGLISRAGIVPLVPSQDSPGVLARCIADVLAVVSVLSHPDPRDTVSLFASRPAIGAARESVAGARLGVARHEMADRAEFSAVAPLFEQALAALSRAGAIIIDPCDLPTAKALQEVRSSVFRTEFKAALNSFLEENGRPCGIGSMAELIAWNKAHPESIPYGQSLLLAAEQTVGLTDPQYRADRVRDIALSRTAGIEAALAMHEADALILPMSAGAKCTGKAGAPVIAVPVGANIDGVPFGITLVGAPGSDSRLLALAAGVERAIGERVIPVL